MLRSKLQHTPRAASTTSLVVQVRDWLAITAVIAGGIWAGIEFFWDKLIAPRLESTLVQISSSSSVVGRTNCCVLVELETKLHNSGRRDAFIHTSHFVAGAKKVDAVPKLDAIAIADLNEKLVSMHLDLPAATGAVALNALYGDAAGPTRNAFLLLSAGDLVNPDSKITPGESIIRRMGLVVPADFPFVSLKAIVLVAHTAQASQSITWNWVLKPITLDLQVIPWRTSDLQTFRDLRDCGIAANDSGKRCREDAMAKGKELMDKFFKGDRYAYTQPHSIEFFAWKAK